MGSHSAKRLCHLHAGELIFGKGSRVISTLLGSCVSVVVFHPGRKIAGICHFALARRQNDDALTHDPRYANDCFHIFAENAAQYQTTLSEFDCSIYGGGNLLDNRLTGSAFRNTEEQANLGEKNALGALRLATQYGCRVTEVDVGEQGYRKLRFFAATGEVECQFFKT